MNMVIGCSTGTIHILYHYYVLPANFQYLNAKKYKHQDIQVLFSIAHLVILSYKIHLSYYHIFETYLLLRN